MGMVQAQYACSQRCKFEPFYLGAAAHGGIRIFTLRKAKMCLHVHLAGVCIYMLLEIGFTQVQRSCQGYESDLLLCCYQSLTLLPCPKGQVQQDC